MERETQANPKMTTIQINEDVHNTLSRLKVVKQEPYNDVIQRLIDFIIAEDDDGVLTNDGRRVIQHRVEEVKQGKVISVDDMKRRLMERRNNEIRRSNGTGT